MISEVLYNPFSIYAAINFEAVKMVVHVIVSRREKKNSLTKYTFHGFAERKIAYSHFRDGVEMFMFSTFGIAAFFLSISPFFTSSSIVI